MSWIYFQASADLVKQPETVSPRSVSTPAPLPTVSVSPSPRPCCCPGCTEARSTPPRSGTTSRHWGALEAARSRNPLTCSLGDGLVRGIALRAFARAWKTSEAAWSAKSLGLWATFDPVLCSWRTSQECLPLQGMESATSCESWPVSGMTVGGRAFQQRKPGLLTPGTDSGFWRTPDTGEGGPSGLLREGKTHRASGAAITVRMLDQAGMWPTPNAMTGGQTSRSGNRKGELLMGGIIRNWATLQSRDHKSGVLYKDRPNSPDLSTLSVKWATPQARDSKSADMPGSGNFERKVENGWTIDLNSQAAGLFVSTEAPKDSHPAPPHPTTGKDGRESSQPAPKLNPQFVEWLMGYPIGTTGLEHWATAWIISRRKRRLKS